MIDTLSVFLGMGIGILAGSIGGVMAVAICVAANRADKRRR